MLYLTQRYTFRITPIHKKTSKGSFFRTNEVLLTKLETLKQDSYSISSGGDCTTVTVEPHKMNIRITLQCMDIMTQLEMFFKVNCKRYIDDQSLVSFCG